MADMSEAAQMYDRGYSYRAIAERMGLSIESARTAVASGRRTLNASALSALTEAEARAEALQDRIDRAILELTIAPPRPAAVLAILRGDHEPIEGVDR